MIRPVPLGAPAFIDAARCTSLDLLDAEIAVLGVPYTTPADLAASRQPCADGPAALRAASARYAETLSHHDFEFGGPLFGDARPRVVDCGDVDADPGRYAENDASASAAVSDLCRAGALPLILGGDNRALTPVLGGLSEHTAVLSLSPVPVPVLLSVFHAPVVHAGLRGPAGCGPAALERATAAGHAFVPAAKIRSDGPTAVIDRLDAGRPCLLALDVSVLDPSLAPGVLAPAFGGLSYPDVVAIIEGLARRTPIAAIAVTGLVAARDVQGLTAALAARLALVALGHVIHARVDGAEADARPGAPAAARAEVAYA